MLFKWRVHDTVTDSDILTEISSIARQTMAIQVASVLKEYGYAIGMTSGCAFRINKPAFYKQFIMMMGFPGKALCVDLSDKQGEIIVIRKT